MANRPKKQTKQVEIKDILGLFVWGINLDLDKVDPEKVKSAGFNSVKDACLFWQGNKDEFKPLLAGNQFENVENSVETTMEYLNGYTPEWRR